MGVLKVRRRKAQLWEERKRFLRGRLRRYDGMRPDLLMLLAPTGVRGDTSDDEHVDGRLLSNGHAPGEVVRAAGFEPATQAL